MKSAAQVLACLFSVMVIYQSCSKGGGTEEKPDPCAGVTVSVTGTTTEATTGQNNGSITATASGGSGFTYSLNNGAFQASGTFSNLAAATYTIVARNSNGCTGSAQFTVTNSTATTNPCTGTAGPLYTAVKAVIQANCSSCHNASKSEGGMNWDLDCNIINNKARIKTRAVDQAGTASQMPLPPNPALSVADRNKITAWIDAGGTITN